MDKFRVFSHSAGEERGLTEAAPAPRRPPVPAVNDELIRILCDVRIEIVHQHPHRGFLMPAFTTQVGPARRANGPSRTGGSFPAHKSSNAPARIFWATRAMSPDRARSAVSGLATSLTRLKA